MPPEIGNIYVLLCANVYGKLAGKKQQGDGQAEGRGFCFSEQMELRCTSVVLATEGFDLMYD